MDRSAVTLERMRSFVRIAERGSLSAVARERGVGQATISRHLAELEHGLGVTLLHRTTRHVKLTDEGARYLEDARTILRLVDEASDQAASAGSGLAGEVHVSCTSALGVRHVARTLFAFQDRHPAVKVDLHLSDVRIDLVSEATDVAIRLGPVPEGPLRRRSIGHSRRILAASRSYLDQYGRPTQPGDMSRHQTIRMSNVAGSETVLLHRPGEPSHPVPFGGRLMVDHGLAAREALIEGRGVAAAHVWLIDDLLESGEVEQVLPDFAPDPVPLSILFLPRRARIKRIRALVDVLADALERLPGMQ